MRLGGVLLLGVFILGGCREAEVRIDGAPPELRASTPTAVATIEDMSTEIASPSASARHASPSPTPDSSAGDTEPAAGHWWSNDIEQLDQAFNRCGQPDSRWRPVECRFIGGLFMGTHETYGVIVREHGVDLISAGWSMCKQMDQFPDPEMFDDNLVPPDNWPDTMGFELAYIAVIASQTMCDQHAEVGAWLMTPREVQPTTSPAK